MVFAPPAAAVARPPGVDASSRGPLANQQASEAPWSGLGPITATTSAIMASATPPDDCKHSKMLQILLESFLGVYSSAIRPASGPAGQLATTTSLEPAPSPLSLHVSQRRRRRVWGGVGSHITMQCHAMALVPERCGCFVPSAPPPPVLMPACQPIALLVTT